MMRVDLGVQHPIIELPKNNYAYADGRRIKLVTGDVSGNPLATSNSKTNSFSVLHNNFR
jgi:hypothetical protein